MATLASFHWGWLLASAVLGLLAGWISVVQRGDGLSVRVMRWLLGALAILIAVAVARLLPGRWGYWLDLGLAMGFCYLAGCVIGSRLRDRVVSRASARTIATDI